MADPHKCRVGRSVAVTYGGLVHFGEFRGIVPANPKGRNYEKRQEQIVVANGPDIIEYIPNVEGQTLFRYR